MMAQEHFASIPGMTMVKANKSYSGSHGGMQWKVRIADDALAVLCWPMPWCLEKTDEALVVQTSVPLSEDGLREAEQWIEQQYENEAERWHAAAESSWI